MAQENGIHSEFLHQSGVQKDRGRRIRINVSIAQNDILNKAIDLSVVEEDVKSLQSVMQRLGLDSKVCSNTIIELYKIRRSEIS